jgi:hypothetical protein
MMHRATARGLAGVPAATTKALELVRLMGANPVEFYDRVRAKVEVAGRKRWPTRVRYSAVTWDTLAPQLSVIAGDATRLAAQVDEFRAVHQALATRARSMPRVPFPVLFDADPVLARLAYVLTRVLQPEIVVETGVALGIVSSSVLSALDRNGCGRLISIDLPPLGVQADAVGAIIPDALRARWTLYRGSSTRVLRRIAGGLPPVGLFVHDSLFTWRNSTREYAQVLPHMAERSAIIANCVQHSRAFAELVAQHPPSMQAAVVAEQKPGERIGVWIRARDPGHHP